ncbi:MAG: Na+/H+ antiporter subunit E [Kiritimatiellae bacterium]|nr:Na+/H+ antiporter subunit E [Kiritimatiellia bacterium]
MMTLLSNLGISVLWVLITGNFNTLNLIFGFGLGYVLLGAMRTEDQDRSYFRKARQSAWFILRFFIEMITASTKVAYDVITPHNYMTPRIIAYELEAKTDLEITLFANAVSLTPGTLSLDVSDDRKVLQIHAMYVDDEAKLIKSIRDTLERPLLQVMR